jgi:hypothetical protein
MQWKRRTLSHTTTIGTHRIVRLPGTREEDFVRTLREVLATASLPDLNRVTNVEAQELQRDESGGVVDSYLWVIYFRGVDQPESVREKCEAMYESVREKLDSVGVRTSFSLATLEGRWEAEP